MIDVRSPLKAFLIVLALAMQASSTAAQNTPWRVGEPAPHLHLPEIGSRDAVDLASYRGKKVLIAEFASW